MHKHLIALLGAGTITLGTVHVHGTHTHTRSHRPPRLHVSHVTLGSYHGRRHF